MTMTEQDLQDVLGSPEAKTQTAHEKYAFTGGDTPMMPLDQRHQIEKSANYFHRHRTSFPYRQRRTIARRILKEADARDVDVPHRRYLHQAAGMGLPDMRKLARHMMVRANDAPEDMREELHKQAVAVRDMDPDEEVAAKCAELMAEVDETSGQYRRYDDGLAMPEKAAFPYALEDLEKAAECLVQLPNGTVVTKEQLDNAPLSKAAKAIGGEFEQEVIRRMDEPNLMRKLAGTLSEPDADTLEAFLPKEGGIDLSLFDGVL